MKIAVMQPYLFPYIGYFQLILAVDKFVVYDDVNFIKQGWVNRNYLLVNEKKSIFTVPLQGASSFKRIRDIAINKAQYDRWSDKFFKTIELSYRKAPFYKDIYPLLQKVLGEDYATISWLAFASIKSASDYIGIKTEFVQSSTVYGNDHLKGEERVIDICKREEASEYINLSGGMSIYSKEKFAKEGIKLSFIKSRQVSYRQISGEFVPDLSVIDPLMFNDSQGIRDILEGYNLM